MKKLLIYYLALFLVGSYHKILSFHIDCSTRQHLKFFKITGYRPPDSKFHLTRKIFNSSTKKNCLKQCYEEINCVSVVLFVNDINCVGFFSVKSFAEIYPLLRENQLVPDIQAIFFQKTCQEFKPFKGKIWPYFIASYAVDNAKIQTSQGSQLILSTPKMPKMYIRILDENQINSINIVEIGVPIELQIIMMNPNENLYDFQPFSLIAKSNNKNSTIFLLDSFGCPLNKKIFPALERTKYKNITIMHTKFRAFKFPDTIKVEFEVKIRFCETKCKYHHNCIPYDNTSKRFPYRRKRTSKSFDDLLFNNNGLSIAANITELTRQQFYNVDGIIREDLQIPLEVSLIVQDSRKFKVKNKTRTQLKASIPAKIDNPKTPYCIDKPILISAMIFCIIFLFALTVVFYYLVAKFKQIIAYERDQQTLKIIHSSLGGTENNRHVRWADQINFVKLA